MMRTLRLIALALTLATALPARAAADYTDIWWAFGGTEPGWGINLAQNANTIFATFFVYSATGAPTWYTALLTRTVGETFVGTVSVSTGGAWFGSPSWVPPTTVAVGTASFVASSLFRGTLTYSVDTVNVVKTIERTTLVGIDVSGLFLGAVTARRDGSCATTYFDSVQFQVTQSGAPGIVRIDQLSAIDGSLVCRMEGAGVQYGGVIDMPDAAYTCPGIINAGAHVMGLRATASGFEARWFSDLGSGCTETGNISGATQFP